MDEAVPLGSTRFTYGLVSPPLSQGVYRNPLDGEVQVSVYPQL